MGYPRSRDPDGFGSREPGGRDAVPVRPDEEARFRAGPGLLLGLAVFVAVVLVMGFGFLVGGDPGSGIVLLVFGGLAFAQLAGLALVPLVRMRGFTLAVWSGTLGRPPSLVDVRRVEWRPDARYVGRWIRATDVRGRTVRLPVWLMNRRHARRLFDHFDRLAEEHVLDADR
jgi:hypothetical protein